MHAYPKNAAPRAVIGGIKDSPSTEPVRQPFLRPTHCQLSLIRAGWGPETDQFVSGDFIKTLYGEDVFEPRGKHFTHANLLARQINEAANSQIMVRMVPEDAPAPAGFTLWIETVVDAVPNYVRNEDGSYKLTNGAKTVDSANPTRPGGLRFRLSTTALDKDSEGNVVLGNQKKTSGDLVSGETQTSGDKLPLGDFQRPHRGERGNWGGMRISPLFTNTRNGVRPDLVESLQAMVFRFQLVERPAAGRSPIRQLTNRSADYLDLSFKAGAYDEVMRRSIDVREDLLKAYNAKSTDGGPDKFGVFSDMYIYEDNLKAVQKAFMDVEASEGTLGYNGGEATADLVNFLTAVSPEGIPYYNVVRDGGLLFTESSTHYALGGGDGTVTDESYNSSVIKFVDEFMVSPLRLWDPFRVPISSFYDSGFPLPVKLKLCRLLALRDDINVYIATQTYGQPMLSETDEYSIGQVIAQEMLSYPESVLWGTGTCRGRIMGNAGVRTALNIGNKVIPTILFNYAEKMANFAGARSGQLDHSWLPSLPSRNVLVGLEQSNAQSKSDNTIDDFWDRGIIYAQYKDRATTFVPAYQTVLEDDSSSLNNDMAVFLITDVIKICREVWTELTGQQGMSEESFILASNTEISKRTSKKYGNLLRVTPDTYFTELDTELGYPWNCRVRCESDPLRTVGLFEVLGARPNQ